MRPRPLTAAPDRGSLFIPRLWHIPQHPRRRATASESQTGLKVRSAARRPAKSPRPAQCSLPACTRRRWTAPQFCRDHIKIPVVGRTHTEQQAAAVLDPVHQAEQFLSQRFNIGHEHNSGLIIFRCGQIIHRDFGQVDHIGGNLHVLQKLCKSSLASSTPLCLVSQSSRRVAGCSCSACALEMACSCGRYDRRKRV